MANQTPKSPLNIPLKTKATKDIKPTEETTTQELIIGTDNANVGVGLISGKANNGNSIEGAVLSGELYGSGVNLITQQEVDVNGKAVKNAFSEYTEKYLTDDLIPISRELL